MWAEMYVRRGFKGKDGESRMIQQTHKNLLMLAVLLVTSLVLAGMPAVFAEPGEDGKSSASQGLPGVVLLDGTRVDIALASALSSSAPVPVIILLKDQPARGVVEAIQSRYLPRASEKGRAVRDILARYAGPRNLTSAEDVREQASRESAAVTRSDKARVKALNAEADAILDEMRKEISRELRSAVAAEQSQAIAAIVTAGGRVSYGYSIRNAVAARH
jgi:hypothetical protein